MDTERKGQSSRLGRAVARLSLSLGAMVALWLMLLRYEVSRQQFAERFEFDLAAWLAPIGIGIAAGFLFALVFVVPTRGKYRWGTVLVALLPPFFFHVQFLFFWLWVFPRNWDGPSFLRPGRLGQDVATLLLLAVLMGVAIGLGFLPDRQTSSRPPNQDAEPLAADVAGM